MNSVPLVAGHRPASAPRPLPVHLGLLGTGTVGAAVLKRLASWDGTSLGKRLRLLHVANSRFAFKPFGSELGPALVRFDIEEGLRTLPALLGRAAVRIIIDATASDAVAGQHAQWLAQGVHVVTACKLGQGTSLARWQAIRAGCAHGDTRYGDSATVGAGLPMLRSIRELQAGGDCIHAVAGVLSGSMAWLCNHYDGLRPFSNFVRSARDAGYTEPDPRDDLSGEDVRRKLLILARASGVALDAHDIEIGSLVPEELRTLSMQAADEALSLLDEPLRERYANAYRSGEKLRFIARLQRDSHAGTTSAKVGLESLPDTDSLSGGAGTDNRLAIWSDRYPTQPLLIQGPGAGAGVTAAALLDDVLRIASSVTDQG
ncbi:MAG: homoserine dehydrogenase family protein [Xanthomonadaceae bacterium]|nr:homoserine dehydrogenase family protein [Xanthomonadaceae bacterium]